jgi:hypothetical protein
VLCCFLTAQQTTPSVASSTVVPRLVNFAGKALDEQGKPISGTAAATFAIYKDQEAGAPLWLETQSVTADKAGHYTAQLGASKPDGLPVDLFGSGEARWLGVTVNGGREQPRTLLLSVPYALKALDAETIGGRPASSFMSAPASSTNSSNPAAPPGTITGSGTADFVPMFTGATTIGNSKIFQTVGGNVGIATTTPAAKLDVAGSGDVRDTLTLFPKLTHPVLSVHGTALSVDHTGLLTFVSGQTFPGTGTVTSVGSGAGLTGGPITHSGTLSIATGGVTNGMLAHPSLTVTANSPLTGGGSVSLGGSTSLGLTSSCSSGQILKWNGSAWGCAADNNSGGTVTSAGMSAPSSDFTVSGSPITGSGTLGLNWTIAPTSAATANAIVKRDTSGSFSAGAISASLGVTSLSSGIAVYGETSGSGGGADGVHGVAHGTGSGVTGLSDNANGAGVWAQGPGYALYANGNTGQARTAGGLAKAMVFVSGYGSSIISCFNSTLSGSAATTPPCGFLLDKTGTGDYIVDFGFEVDDRFISATTGDWALTIGVCDDFIGGCNNSTSANQLEVTSYAPIINAYYDTKFYLIVF